MLGQHWLQYTSPVTPFTPAPSPHTAMALVLVLPTRYVQRHGDNHGFYNNTLFKCEGVVGSGLGAAVIMVFQRLSDLWFLHLLNVIA